MRKLLLAGALVLTVACQKETIEEAANDFAVEEVNGLSAKNAAIQWELGSSVSVQQFNSEGSDYIVSQYRANINGVGEDVFITFILRDSGWDLSGIQVINDLLGPNEKRTVLTPSEIVEFKFNIDTGVFYINGVFGEYGNVNIEISGTIVR